MCVCVCVRLTHVRQGCYAGVFVHKDLVDQTDNIYLANSKPGFDIDAKLFGNIFRFVNSSRTEEGANVQFCVQNAHGDVGVFALRDICFGEKLSSFYGHQYFAAREIEPVSLPSSQSSSSQSTQLQPPRPMLADVAEFLLSDIENVDEDDDSIVAVKVEPAPTPPPPPPQMLCQQGWSSYDVFLHQTDQQQPVDQPWGAMLAQPQQVEVEQRDEHGQGDGHEQQRLQEVEEDEEDAEMWKKPPPPVQKCRRRRNPIDELQSGLDGVKWLTDGNKRKRVKAVPENMSLITSHFRPAVHQERK